MGDDTVRGVVMALAALLPPGVAVFRHPGRGLRLTERLLLAAALGPFALAAPALLLGWVLRLPVDWALWQSEFLWVVAALWPRGATAPGQAPAGELPERGQGFPSIAALTTALFAAVLVAGVAFAVPMVRTWSDAWFHAGVALEVARRGVPPQDPNFAGVPLYYPWIYHYVLALLGSAGRLSPFHSMALINAWAAIVAVLAAAQLAYRIAGRGAAMWAGAIVVLGLNPLGWVLWLIRGSVGETRGLASMIGQLATTNGAATGLTHLFPPWHVSLLNRLWTGTALTPAIALGLAVAWSTARALDRPGPGAWLRTMLLALALFAVHPAYAAFAAATIGIGLAGTMFTAGQRGTALAQLAALSAAALAGAIWIRACSVPGVTTGVQIGIYMRNLWSLLIAVGPWWLVAAPGFVLAWRHGAAGRFAVAAASAAVVLALAVVLPEFNSDKLLYLAWVALAPLASAGFVAWVERFRLPAVGRAALLALLVVPTAGLYTLGTASDRRSPGVLVRGDTPEARRKPPATAAEAEAYRFLRDRLPEDAVVIEQARPTVNEPIAVMGERRVFCGALNVYLANHFGNGEGKSREMRALIEEFRVRQGIRRALFSDGTLTAAQATYLSQFSMPVFLLVRREEVSDAVWEGFRRLPEWGEILANDEVRLYRFRPDLP